MERGVTLSEMLLEGRPRLVSFVGAGGKTGLMLGLAREISGRRKGRKVIVTTTTHMRRDDLDDDIILVRWRRGGGSGVDADVRRVWRVGGIPLVFSKEEGGRLKGLGRSAVEGVLELGGTVLVEADGALRLPVKRLRRHEPVIPRGDGGGGAAGRRPLTCIIVGADAVGRPLGEGTCFNWKGVVEKGITGEGEAMTPMIIRDILFRKRGFMDAVPDGHRAVVIVNKVDTGAMVRKGTELARHLFHPRASGILLATSGRQGGGGRAKGSGPRCWPVGNVDDRVFAVVLAAGSGERFGGQKLLERAGGETLIERVVRKALLCRGFEMVVLVVGSEAGRVREAVRDLDCPRLMTVENMDHARGMSTSMRAGMEAAAAHGADAVAFLLGDMPRIRTELMERVVVGYRGTCCRICLPRAGDGRPGHPVVVRKDLFDEMRKVTGDRGAREVVRRNLDWALALDASGRPVDEQLDIDYIKDMDGFRKEAGGRRRGSGRGRKV